MIRTDDFLSGFTGFRVVDEHPLEGELVARGAKVGSPAGGKPNPVRGDDFASWDLEVPEQTFHFAVDACRGNGMPGTGGGEDLYGIESLDPGA